MTALETIIFTVDPGQGHQHLQSKDPKLITFMHDL